MISSWIESLSRARGPLSIYRATNCQYGILRDEVTKTLDEYLNCGILAHGAARVYCDGCKHSLLIAFSCKRRGVCPSCGAKRAVKFAEHIYNEVIEDVPHRHTVFTIPKRLRVFFKYNRALLSILFKAAWGALSQVLGVNDKELAAIFTVQTAGESLNFHPHLHGLLADGYWHDGVLTRFSEIDLAAITQAFAEGVLAQLHKRVRYTPVKDIMKSQGIPDLLVPTEPWRSWTSTPAHSEVHRYFRGY